MNILSTSHILAILYTNTYIGRLVIIAIQNAPKNTIFQSNITVRVTTKNHLGAPCCYFMQHCHFSQRPLNVRDIQVCQESYFQDTVSISWSWSSSSWSWSSSSPSSSWSSTPSKSKVNDNFYSATVTYLLAVSTISYLDLLDLQSVFIQCCRFCCAPSDGAIGFCEIWWFYFYL